MEWRPSKSSSLVLESGSVSKCEFEVSSSSHTSEAIPPVRFLSKWMDDTISDKRGSNSLDQQIEAGLEKLDKSNLLGVNKVWILQFLLLQQVRWTIMIYDIPISVVEKFEQRTSKFIQRWLGFHPTLSSIALCFKHSPCPLPLTSLVKPSSLPKTALFCS